MKYVDTYNDLLLHNCPDVQRGILTAGNSSDMPVLGFARLKPIVQVHVTMPNGASHVCKTGESETMYATWKDCLCCTSKTCRRCHAGKTT